MTAALALASLAAATVVVAALTAPAKPDTLPTADSVRQTDPDEEWARETTQELRAIRADLAATAVEEHRRMRRRRAGAGGLAALKRELALRRRLRQAGWREHLAGRLP